MSDAPSERARGAADVDPDELVRELRRQISVVRSRMEEHRETMLAAGLTNLAPLEEPVSWTPPQERRRIPLLKPRCGLGGCSPRPGDSPERRIFLRACTEP
jgi:hypothetical protein